MAEEAGKGDKRRPQEVSDEQFAANWDVIFSNKEKVEEDGDIPISNCGSMVK